MSLYLHQCALLFCLFPWVSFRLLNLDTQPWFILLSLICFALSLRKKINIKILAVIFLPISSVAIGFVYKQFDALFFRAVMSYFAYFIVLVFYFIYKKKYGSPINILMISNVIWLFAGVTQFLLGKEILSNIVVVRTTMDRGVTGLAPEPTFYGIFLFFLTWLIIIESRFEFNFKIKVIVFFNIAAIMFLASSSMVVLYFVVVVLLYAVFYMLSIKRFFILSVLLLVLYFALDDFLLAFETTRLAKLIVMVSTEPELILLKDASINERVSHVFFSIKGFLVDFGVPHGFHQFGDYSTNERHLSNGLFWWGKGEDKIMSNIGAVMYELGWFSIVYILSLFSFLKINMHVKRNLFNAFLLGIILLSAIPVSFPLIPMIVVSMYFSNEEVYEDYCFNREC